MSACNLAQFGTITSAYTVRVSGLPFTDFTDLFCNFWQSTWEKIHNIKYNEIPIKYLYGLTYIANPGMDE